MTTISRQTPGSKVLEILRMSWDGDDNWGASSEAAWAVAVTAYAVECREAVDILQYRPSPLGSPTMDELTTIGDEDSDITIQMCDVATAYAYNRIVDEDLIFAAKVLRRYRDLLIKAGQDY
jgi:hypothetical protein